MKGFMNSGFLKKGLPVVGLMLVGVLILGVVNLVHASSLGETELEWRHIVGIILAGNTVGNGTGKVTGGGAPWHTTDGSAEVNLTTGDLRFHVDGLVLAAGNSIGTPGGVASVKGTLVCDTTGVNSTLVDTTLVTLSAQGDARFKGNVGTLPAACTTQPNIAFLIRTGGGAWLASGMVRVTETDDDRR